MTADLLTLARESIRPGCECRGCKLARGVLALSERLEACDDEVHARLSLTEEVERLNGIAEEQEAVIVPARDRH